MKSFLILSLLGSAALYAQAPTIGNCTVFPADSIWNTPVDTLPLSANSATYVSTIGASSPMHADFGSGTWNGGPIGIPFITVPGTQTKYPATFTYWDESDAGPYAVPLTAPIEGGSASSGDRHAIAVDVDHCILYELYAAYPQTSSWQAGSGAIFSLTSHTLRPAGWTSADAAGLPVMPGLVRYDEVAAGEIRHALRFTVPSTRHAYVWPARHYASSLTDLKYPPMGQRFRLKASFDISPYPADVQVILRALKKYGMMIADNGSAWYLSGAPDSRWNNTNLSTMRNITGAAFEAVDVSSLMLDPDSDQVKPVGVTVSVTVTPSSATVVTGASRQFTATVQNLADQTVNWSVNGTLGGNPQVGSIDTHGLYFAPGLVPSPATVSVQATSLSAPQAKGSAAVTIVNPPAITVSVSPTSATVRVGRTAQFKATVQGTTNTQVTWKVNGITGGNSTAGSISASGLYTAPSRVPSPATVTVSAVSAADSTRSGKASVKVVRK